MCSPVTPDKLTNLTLLSTTILICRFDYIMFLSICVLVLRFAGSSYSLRYAAVRKEYTASQNIDTFTSRFVIRMPSWILQAAKMRIST